MAIVGTLWDRALTQSRAGDALSGVTMSTLAHSLPATNPQIAWAVMRSVQGIGHNPPVTLLAQRGNASLSTVGFVTASTASAPTIEYDYYCAILHTIIS